MRSSFRIIISFNAFTEYSFFENFFSYIYGVQNLFNFLFLSFFCVKKKKSFTINRSPFVNNKAKEQYALYTYTGKITFKINVIVINYKIYKLLYMYLKKNLLSFNKIFTKITFKKVSKYF